MQKTRLPPTLEARLGKTVTDHRCPGCKNVGDFTKRYDDGDYEYWCPKDECRVRSYEVRRL